MSVCSQLAREKSLVPECSRIRRNPSDISKGILQNDISKFESCRASQPLSVSVGPFPLEKVATLPWLAVHFLCSGNSRIRRLPRITRQSLVANFQYSNLDGGDWVRSH